MNKCKRCYQALTRDDHITKGTNSIGWINNPTVCMKCKSEIGAKARLASLKSSYRDFQSKLD